MKHKKLSTTIKKAQWMLAKVDSMVHDDVYCVDIATQVNAVIGLLKEANRQILKQHLACCGKKKLVSKNPAEVENFIDELVRVWDVSTRK